MQVQQLLQTGAAQLARAGVADSGITAEQLLQACLKVSRSRLFLLFDQQATPDQEKRFHAYLSRRCLREPLQYIVGSCEFWSLEFTVSPTVLIPRPETEFLLEHVLSVLDLEPVVSAPEILDLCTGSGVIAVVLAREIERATLAAVDFSREALVVARKNISRHGVRNRINLLCGDLFDPLEPTLLFDVIVSNPPYVKAADIEGLEPEVRTWEPRLALSGGVDGMDIIHRICNDAPDHLKPGGWLFMEIGADIQQPVEQIFLCSTRYEQVRVLLDWAGKPRVLQARFIK